jgi:hypothetical protein
MFETQVLDEVHRLQSQMATLRRKYGTFCSNELQIALHSAHEAIDNVVDLATTSAQAKEQREVEQHA